MGIFRFPVNVRLMRTLFMASLGCAKNLVDAETILGETLGDDFALAVSPENADIVIVNTCGFIHDAREEARAVLREFLGCKKQNPRLKVAAIGCWAERSPEEIRKEFPDLDAVWGLDIPSSLGAMLKNLLAGAGKEGEREAAPPERAEPPFPRAPREGARLVATLPSFAYLRLSDGCDNCCRYCAIPLIRGGLRSREPQSIVEEAKILADQGAQELVVIGQDTTAYGMDFRGRPDVTLQSLLEQLLAGVDVPRIRLLYAHPAHLADSVIDLLRTEPRLCRYLDLPIQHASDSVLKRMGRGYGRDRVLHIVDRLAGCDFTLRTTILAGFPGETEEEFADALELVAAGHFRHAGAFAYSPEPGTEAFSLPDRVPDGIALGRMRAIMEAQEGSAFEWLDSRVGGTESVLVDSRADGEWLVGRTRHEAPDADGAVFVRSRRHGPGDTVLACVAGREGYDLVSEIAQGTQSNRPGSKPGKRRRRR